MDGLTKETVEITLPTGRVAVIRETDGADEEAVDRLVRQMTNIETGVQYATAFGKALMLTSVVSVDGVKLPPFRKVLDYRQVAGGFKSSELRAIEKASSALNGMADDSGEADGDASQDEDGSESASPSSAPGSRGRRHAASRE